MSNTKPTRTLTRRFETIGGGYTLTVDHEAGRFFLSDGVHDETWGPIQADVALLPELIATLQAAWKEVNPA